jgi:hypothetical protein
VPVIRRSLRHQIREARLIHAAQIHLLHPIRRLGSDHFLETNEIPASPRELTVDAVKNTRLVGKEGHQALPSSSPVSAVGCLVLDSGNGWFLTKATEPERTLDDEISAAELQAAKDEPLGDLLFRLQDITDIPDFNPDALRDKKVEAKGILVLQPGNLRINVTALKVAAAECER